MSQPNVRNDKDNTKYNLCRHSLFGGYFHRWKIIEVSD
jgi:hypothetical protein